MLADKNYPKQMEQASDPIQKEELEKQCRAEQTALDTLIRHLAALALFSSTLVPGLRRQIL